MQTQRAPAHAHRAQEPLPLNCRVLREFSQNKRDGHTVARCNTLKLLYAMQDDAAGAPLFGCGAREECGSGFWRPTRLMSDTV